MKSTDRGQKSEHSADMARVRTHGGVRGGICKVVGGDDHCRLCVCFKKREPLGCGWRSRGKIELGGLGWSGDGVNKGGRGESFLLLFFLMLFFCFCVDTNQQRSRKIKQRRAHSVWRYFLSLFSLIFHIECLVDGEDTFFFDCFWLSFVLSFCTCDPNRLIPTSKPAKQVVCAKW